MNFLSSGTDKSSEHSIKLSRTDDTPRTQMTNDTEISVSHSPKEYNQFLSNTILLEHFTKIFLHLRRAVVRYAFLLNILFITKHCITILTTFYIKKLSLLRNFKKTPVGKSNDFSSSAKCPSTVYEMSDISPIIMYISIKHIVIYINVLFFI